MRRAGFTLTELLVVIGIILLLLGLLLPALSIVKRHAVRTKCIVLIHQVDAACDIYRNLNGAYPDTPANWTAATTMKDLFTTGTTLKLADDSSIDWETISQMLLSALRAVDRDHFGTLTQLHDPWNQPLHYRPVQYYPYQANAALVVDADPPPHPDSYQLWSSGYDEHNDCGKDGSDDVTNWK